jgi:hypothetical protein
MVINNFTDNAKQKLQLIEEHARSFHELEEQSVKKAIESNFFEGIAKSEILSAGKSLELKENVLEVLYKGKV